MRVPKAPEPFSERQVAPEILKGSFETHVPEGAFGGISERNIGEEEKTTELLVKAQDQADAYKFNEAKNAYNTEIQKWLPNVLQTKEKNAFPYSPDNVEGPTQKFLTPLSEKIKGMVQNGRQAKAIGEWVDRMDVSTKGQLSTHVAKQAYLSAGTDALDNINKTLGLVGTLNNPNAIATYRYNLYQDVQRYKDVMGKSGDTYQDEHWLQKFDDAVAGNHLAQGNIKGAVDYTKAVQANGGVIGKNTQAKITQAQTNIEATDWSKKNSLTLKNSDGYIDTQKGLALIKSMNLPPDKEKVYQTTFLAQAKKETTAINQAYIRSWNTFLDNEGKLRQSKSSRESMISMAQGMGGSPREIQRRIDYINNLDEKTGGFTLNIGGKSEATLAKMHENLVEAIQDGYLTKVTDINKLYDEKYLTRDQYTDALKMFDTASKGQASKEVAMTRNQIRRQAEDALDSPQEVSQFMIDLAKNTVGKEPKDMKAWAKENLEPEEKNPSHFWNQINNQKDSIFGVREEEPELSDTNLTRSLNAEIGRTQMSGITEALKAEGIENPRPEDFAKALQEFGNVPLSAIGRGTPINNAILSITNHNKINPNDAIPMTLRNIKYWAEATKNGWF